MHCDPDQGDEGRRYRITALGEDLHVEAVYTRGEPDYYMNTLELRYFDGDDTEANYVNPMISDFDIDVGPAHVVGWADLDANRVIGAANNHVHPDGEQIEVELRC